MTIACGLLMGAWVLQSCKDDDVLLTGQPSWLGNSIYERLQEDGHYSTVLRLADDLGLHEVLSHTGSRTVFAANDSAYDEWFKHNDWGVSRYEQLSTAQKKLLLNNSMVKNAYLIELLSNTSGNPPEEGMCMRRETASSIYDSVEIVRPEMMPNTAPWQQYKKAGKSIALLKDATSAPMIHFLPAYMRKYNITTEDLEILTNHQANSINEAWVNGKKVVERDITCKNGYIQKVDGVIESSPNMAEIIRQHANMSRWSQLLDRFSAPYYNATATREYNRLYNNEDSVYTLYYYSRRSGRNSGGQNATDPSGEAVEATLSFDPGWNHYIYSNTMGYDLHYDAGAMIVPTNEALEAWWNGDGKDLQDEYKTWDSIPDKTLAKLINVNMLPTFTGAIPSKFSQVLNDAKEELGIRPEDVDSCFMGCNGVVYLTNKVFPPAEYASVAYPALAHESLMNIIYWVIDQQNFLPYLLSMDNTYSLLLPTNDGMMWYLDPAYYGTTDNATGMEAPTLLEFYYDKRKAESERVRANRYRTLVDADGNITKGDIIERDVSQSVVVDRLKRLMDDLIVIGDVTDGHEYYKTKGGSLVRVSRSADGRIAFSGGWQMEHGNCALPVDDNAIYEKSNGRSYGISGGVPMGAQNSVYWTLRNHEEFSEFYNLLGGADFCTSELKLGQSTYSPAMSRMNNRNITLMDNYNYTVYVPTNESIRELIDNDLLPTWDDYDAIKLETWGTRDLRDSARAIVKDIITSFLRYHIQDHSVAINMATDVFDTDDEGTSTPLYANTYESMRRNPVTGRFFPIEVDFSGNQISLTDAMGQQRHVMKDNGLYNLICREYWFNIPTVMNTPSLATSTIYSASDAVVHQIDKPLMFQKLTSWKEQLKALGRE
jgi:uncharacterized surface protein with fasciclin (FAS1) repeats